MAGDRAYTDAKAENFALPARALGYKPVLDYAEDHLGVQGSVQGFLFIEGALYCPAIPEVLITASIDVSNNKIDEPTYRARLRERWRYAARPKADADADGYRRWQCPAAGPNPVASCPLKPASQHHDGKLRLDVRPSGTIKANPPASCAQGSVTIEPEPMAKLRQDLFFESPEWSTRYHTLRSTVEGMNGFLKDGVREALDDPERRRVRGVAAQSFFVALLVFAGNLRKIEEFLKFTGGLNPARRARQSRRRRGKSLAEWVPAGTSEAHRPEERDTS